MTLHKKAFLLFIVILQLTLYGCASQGRLSYSDYEEIKITASTRTLLFDKNPNFIIAGDSQPGKRIVEKFLRKENWATWKQLIFPFYQTYLFGNGFYGLYQHLTHTDDYGEKDRQIINDHLVRHLENNPTDFYLMLGDIVGADGRYPSHWNTFFDSFGGDSGIIGKTPIYPMIGNHEYANDDSIGYYNFNTVFQSPRFYTIETPDMAIILLDSNFLLDQAGLIEENKQEELFKQWFVSGSSNPSWLEKELQNNEGKILIIGMHHSPMMLGWHFKDWYKPENGLNLTDKRKALIELFKKYQVNIVLSGHEHYYQHNILDYNSGEDQMHFIITSSAGVPIRSKPNDSTLSLKIDRLKHEGYSLTPIMQEDSYHFSRIEFQNDELIFNTYRIETGKSDEIFDTFRLKHFD